MLFNSPLFLFLFLPITLLGYHLIGKSKQPRLAIIWLVATSLLFYAWANPIYLALITGSVLFNYAAGMKLARAEPARQRKLVMILGVTANILLLGFFKYANFFIDNTNALLGSSFHPGAIILPLAISFFTLQQVAYLVDIYRGERLEHGFMEYCLFVTFFPKLLSGPIVRLKELMPQIGKNYRPYLTWQNLAVGLTVLFLGLFKKVILADNLQVYATPVFDAAAQGTGMNFFNSWSGALAYTLQLYFDFSGYSDIAIGLGLMFGIRLPLNFYSPYKAKSIIDFWSRWHMTLSRFIRDYIYIPLGGNRHGFFHQIIYLLVAMIIAGFWHGAGWTFVIWGALHGFYLAVNHIWRRVRSTPGYKAEKATWWGTVISTLITFIAVTIAWVFFRADSFGAAVMMLKAMALAGTDGFHPPDGFSTLAVIWISVSLFICWFLPNVQEYMSDFRPALDKFPGKAERRFLPGLRWKPSPGWAAVIACMAILVILGLSHVSKFIYFQF